VSLTDSAGVRRPEFHQARDILKEPLPPVVLETAEIDGVHLLAAILRNVAARVKAIVLVRDSSPARIIGTPTAVRRQATPAWRGPPRR